MMAKYIDLNASEVASIFFCLCVSSIYYLSYFNCFFIFSFSKNLSKTIMQPLTNLLNIYGAR